MPLVRASAATGPRVLRTARTAVIHVLDLQHAVLTVRGKTVHVGAVG
jgi:hypothetical protein